MLLGDKIDKIKALFDGLDDGTIVVKKAECDASGNIISATYGLATDVAKNERDIADIVDGDIIVHTAYHAGMDFSGRNLVDLR